MDLLKSNVNKIFFRFLFAALGSALITSVYSLVDCIMVGRYEGPDGTAALAVVMPVWNMIFAFANLFALGGSVLMSNLRGGGRHEKGNMMFTCSFICVCAVTVLMTAAFAVFDGQLLKLFGAGENGRVLALARDYAFWLKFAVPLFTVGQFLAVFIRNDNDPLLATAAVLGGGCFNIVGDYLFVFVADMGAGGAGLATAIGQLIAVCVLLTHFLSKKNTLRFVRPEGFLRALSSMCRSGSPTFVIDMAVALTSTLFNNRIMHYAGPSALAVFGVIINIAMIVQSLSSGIGQAIQPIVSVNYGAGESVRVRKFFVRGLAAVAAMTALVVLACMLLPRQLILLFMTDPGDALSFGPAYMRTYFMAFVFMVFNIFATYYLQAVMRPWLSVFVSLMRSLVLSGGLIMLLPPLVGASSVWWVMPVAEAVTALLAAVILALAATGRLREPRSAASSDSTGEDRDVYS